MKDTKWIASSVKRSHSQEVAQSSGGRIVKAQRQSKGSPGTLCLASVGQCGSVFECKLRFNTECVHACL